MSRQTATMGDMDYRDVGIPELCRWVERLDNTARQSFKALDDRMANHTVSRDVYELRHQQLIDRIVALEGRSARRIEWWQAVIAGVIIALVAGAPGLIVSLTS